MTTTKLAETILRDVPPCPPRRKAMSDLIDKAEALLPCPFCGGEAETTLGPIPGKWGARCKECDVWRDDREGTEAEAIAAWNRRAIPARGAGVKPLVWQPIVKGARRPVGLVLLYRKSVTAEDKLVAAICKGTPETSDEILLGRWRDGAWRQWHTGWTVNGVTHWMTLPKPPSMIAALAPTDAAQDDDPECTDCGGTGITYQTERRCACQPTDAAQAREAALQQPIKETEK